MKDSAARFGKFCLAGVLAAMALGTARLARADEIFDVDLTIGNGSVIGTITTDGTPGTIGPADFVGFDLTINAPFGSAVTTSTSDFYAFSGDDLTVTDSELLFNFSGSPDSGFTLLSDDGSQAWTTGGGGFLQAICGAACDPGGTPGTENDSRMYPVNYTELTGEVAIGTATPEPAALLLFSTGLIGLGVVRARRGDWFGKKNRCEARDS